MRLATLPKESLSVLIKKRTALILQQNACSGFIAEDLNMSNFELSERSKELSNSDELIDELTFKINVLQIRKAAA